MVEIFSRAPRFLFSHTVTEYFSCPPSRYFEGGSKKFSDQFYEWKAQKPYSDGTSKEYGKTSVWLMKSIHAEDQLRQRVAWAFLQQFVVAVSGPSGPLAGTLFRSVGDGDKAKLVFVPVPNFFQVSCNRFNMRTEA